MISQLSHIMTLANSIIGVSVLAMPFCFKQCGIILAIVVLILSSTLSRLACHFLIKSAVMSRRRNFELLAFHAFGHMGKFLVELFIIGFLVGTCIAFFVVMGDLGPQIVRKVIDKSPEDIRTSLLITTSIFIVLPLGLLRNIDSLSTLCTATIIFYLCLVLKIITESMQHIFAGDWYEHVYYWRPSGILQCVPIFSMALFCQTQLFEIYETIPNVSLEKMNEVVRGALNICTIVYLCVGFFGYIAFCTQPFTGNILMSFEPTLSSEMIKMGFVFSIAFSFPLVIFPCRASLNSLLFRRVYSHEPSINYLPETRFRCLTIIIVVVSLITGILIPNIEFVLGLVGSTIGVMICLIFPAIFFISISNKHTNERLLAQVILFIGICIMILSTYANVYALEESTNTKVLATTNKPLNQINSLPLNLNKDDINAVANVPNNPNIEIPPNIKEKIGQLPSLNVLDKSLNLQANDIRQEPPIPVERIVVTDKPMVETQNPVETILVTFAPVIKKMVEEIKTMDTKFHKQSNILVKDDVITQTEFVTGNREENNPIHMKKNNPMEMKESFINTKGHDNSINSDAIKKEESELAAYAEAANMLVSERHEKLRKTLEKHKQEQLQMMEEQKEILKDLREQKQEIERQKQKIIKDTQEHQKYEGKLKAIYKNEKSDTQSNKNVTDTSSINEKVFLKKQKSISDKTSDVVFSNNENPNKEQNIQVDNNHVLFDNKVHNERIRNVGTSLNDTKELPKGPILNALTKRVLQRSISVNNFKLNDSEPDKIMLNNKNTDTDIIFNSGKKSNSKIGKIQHEYSLPIALKMRNQTSVENTLILIENKSEDSVQVIHRDILENHEREKREINMKIEETSTKVISDISNEKPEYVIKNFTIKDNREKCFKQNEQTVENSVNKLKKKISQNLSKSDMVETPLIRTNVYLSEQGFENAVSMDSNIPIRGEYVKLKQRDLKFVNTALLKITNWTPEYFIENRSKCNSILENLEALKEIPLLNINTLQTIKHRQLVKFKGMIQDMHDPECYLRQYEVKNTQTKTCELKCGMYTDSAECLPDEMVLLESENNQSSERGTYTVISIPGLNDWTKETYGQSHLGMKVINNLKRNLDESNSEIINNFESDRKKEKIVVIRDDKEINTMTYDISHQCSFSKEYILNFPIPMDDGRKCIVKIYEDISLKLNQVIEIIGFISLDPFLNGVHYSDEFMTQSEIIVHHPSPSLVPRLHAIKIIQPTKQDIKINSQIMSKAELVRSDLHLILNQLLFGDHLAADYLICHLLSSIYVRRDYFCLGSYPLNITHFPVIKYKEFPKDLYKFLTLLTEKSHLLEITLENLNNLTLLPKKDYECNRLTSGVLQLSNNTHLVIDETGLTTGKMTQIGRENYNAICDLVNFQKVAYDFTYYKMEYETDIPVLILSEAKSFIPCQTQVVLQVDSESKNVYPQIMEIAEQYLKDENRVINIRQYLEIMRDTEFEFNDEELIKEIQGDIVRWRQLNKNVDQLQSLMVLARLLSLSYGSNVLTIEYWKKALQMETERLSRLPDKKEI